MTANSPQPTAAATAPAPRIVAKRPSGISKDIVQLCVGFALIAASTSGGSVLGSGYSAHTLNVANLFIAAAVFQNILADDAGQVSFGQGAILGAGAYAAGIISGMHGAPFAIGAISGITASLVLGLLTALPALRVQGYYLGFVTLAMAIVFPELLTYFSDYTSGLVGISYTLPGLNEPVFGTTSLATLVCAAAACLALLFQVCLRRTRLGRNLRVSAASPEAALTLGISPGRMRCIAFTLASLGTGVVGVLFLPVVGYVGPTTFHLDVSVLLFFAVIVGGQGSLLSPVLGIWLMYLVPNLALADLIQYKMFVYGAITLVIMLVFPSGLIGAVEKLFQRQTARSQPSLQIGQMLAAELRQLEKQADAPTGPAVLRVCGASKRYGSVVALDGVELKVYAGEVHALVGLNGSGKTTLLNMLCGLGRIDSGQIFVGEREVTHVPAYRIGASSVSRTFQTPRIFERLSLLENVTIGLDARSDHAGPHPWQDLVTTLRGTWGHHSVTGMPHGERRLLEFLRTILTGKQILLLDEPAAGLSPDERRDFGLMVRGLCRQLGRTVIIVEHDLDLVWSIADRISVLELGKLVVSGSPLDVIDHPGAEKLFSE